MADVSLAGGGGKTPGTPNTYSPIAVLNFPPGTPVAASVTVAGEVQLAGANGGTFSCPTGIAVTTGVSGHHVLVQYAGPITLTTAEWDAIVVPAGSGGLSAGIFYYLSDAIDEFGKLTTTPPSDPAAVVAPVGIALSPTDFLVRPFFRRINPT